MSKDVRTQCYHEITDKNARYVMENIIYLIIGLVLGLIIMGIVLLIVHNNDKRHLEMLQSQLPEKFSSMAYDALHKNNAEFQTMAKQAQAPIDRLVSDLKTELAYMEENRQKAYGGLLQSTERLNRETQNLHDILNNNQARGGWGEMTLRRIAECAGMVEYCDFKTQDVTVNINGEQIKPDMVITLPNDRQIIVDSKAPMTSYNQAVTCQDHDQQKTLIAGHAKEVKSRIDELSKKNYASAYNAADFVVLFMPNDALLSAAQEGDPNIVEYAMEKGIALATPASLFSLLLAVRAGWNENKLTENAHEIAKIGAKLANSVSIWLEHVQKTGKALNSAMESYNKSIGSIDAHVIRDIQKLSEYGIKEAESIETNLKTYEITSRQSSVDGITGSNQNKSESCAIVEKRFNDINEQPNETTLKAINEVDDMEKHPENYKSFNSVEEAIKDCFE